MGSRRRAVVLALAVVMATAGVAAIAPPAMASGGTAFVSGNTITFTGTEEAEGVGIGGNYEPYCGGAPYCVFFIGGTMTPGTGCKSDAPHQISCVTAGPAQVLMQFGAGDDSYRVDQTYPGVGSIASVTVDGGDGNDTLTGAGPPETLVGGGGDDMIYPDWGPNVANVGPDTIIGGGGKDTLHYGASAGSASGVRISLNGLADDGTSIPGDSDNVGSDIEVIYSTDGNDTVSGDDGSTEFISLVGNDSIDAGAGADMVIGGPGDDTLDGGPGVDRIWGDSDTDPNLSGNDTIVSNDGESDQINCGPGADAVTADSIDKILDACESVTTGGGTTLSAEVAVTKTRLNANKRRKKATLALQCTGGLVCAGNVVVRTTKGKSRRIAGNKKLALGTFTLAANSKQTVKLKLRKPARKILKQTRRAGVRARLTLTNERITTFTNLKLTR